MIIFKLFALALKHSLTYDAVWNRFTHTHTHHTGKSSIKRNVKMRTKKRLERMAGMSCLLNFKVCGIEFHTQRKGTKKPHRRHSTITIYKLHVIGKPVAIIRATGAISFLFISFTVFTRLVHSFIYKHYDYHFFPVIISLVIEISNS